MDKDAQQKQKINKENEEENNMDENGMRKTRQDIPQLSLEKISPTNVKNNLPVCIFVFSFFNYF